MNWTLLVPGALLPPQLAPELSRAIRAPRLAGLLGLARPLPPRIAADAGTRPDGPAASQAAHWQWLARSFGLDDTDLATAPYAWRGVESGNAPMAADTAGWIAHCDPVHMAIARDHFVVTDLAGAELGTAEAGELLDRANAVLAQEERPAGAAAPLQLVVRDGRWFLLSPRPLQLATWALDAVLGQSVQDRLPVGADARRWRILANEIQMSWHASGVHDAREQAGVRTANALWLHGGGTWQPLARPAPRTLRMEGAPGEAAVARGWLLASGAQATAVTGAGPGAGDTLAVCRDLFSAHAHQAWESWVEQWPLLEERIAAEETAARAAGAGVLNLVLCGAAASRPIALPLRAPWWRRLRPGAQPAAALLQRWLTEPPAAAPGALAGRGAGGALAA